MAQAPQPPQPPHKAAAPQQHQTHKPDDKPPAVGGGHLAKTGEADPRHDETKEPRLTIGVKGEPIEDGERDPGTIAEEQRRRSDEIQAAGVERWKYDHDTRSAEEKGPFIEGGMPHPEVEGQRRVEHHESRK